MLIAGPKPPIRARVVENSGTRDREAWVIHDGGDGWHIVENTKVELTTLDSTTLIDSHRFETIRGIGVASNNWVKSLIQGRLIAYLDESMGQVIDSDEIEGRKCWVADVKGLRTDQPEATFRLWVDSENGMILREQLAGIGTVELREIELGGVIENANAPT